MKGQGKTKGELINELAELRQRLAHLEALETDRKHAEEALKRSNELSHIVLNSMNDGVCIIAVSDFNILGCNSVFLKQVGLREEEVIGKTCYEITHHRSEPCRPPDHICPLLDTAASGKYSVAEHVHSSKDDEKVYVEVSTSPIRGEGGRTIQVVYVSRDVTERRRAEEALRQRERELRIRNRIDLIFLTIPDDAMYGEVLQVILEATGSKHGVFGYINEDGSWVAPSLTRDIWEQCQVADKDIIFPRETWGGIWGRALMEGKTLLSNEPGCVPEGHIPVLRSLVVPITYNHEVIGGITLGNKARDYDEQDKQLVEGIADFIAPVLHARLQRDREERERKRAEEELKENAHALNARVKELNCLFEISKLVERPGISLEEILQGVVDLIPPAWQYPEITCARLTLKDQEFRAENYEETTWRQTSDIVVHGERVGTLQACYLEERPESDEGPFLKEERFLINAIAERFGRIIERKWAQDALKEYSDRLEEMVHERTAELRETNELLEEIFSTAHLLIAYMDSDFNFIRVNPAYAAADGREAEFFVGKNHFDLYPHEQNESIFRHAVETGEPHTAYAKPFEYAYHPERGVTYWDWTLHPVKDTAGKVEALILGLVDVTERLKAEETLRESEENFRALAENASDGIVIATSAGELAYANKRAAEISGYSVAGLLEMNLNDLLHPDELQKVMERLQKGLAGEPVSSQYETAVIKKSGETVPVEVTAAQTVWHSQPADIVVVRDITERKQTQVALIQAEKLAITGKLAASLAHEINNPLQTVIGCLGLAEETLAVGGDLSRYLEIGREELQRTARIVAQLRDLQRPWEPEEREPTDVGTLLERVLTLSRKQCQERRVEVVWRSAEDLPPLMLVPNRMQQVFLNLILNALDAMPDGGRLQVSATCSSQPDGVRVSFTDSGLGIAPDLLPQIFEPFYSTKADGLGLGLFISQNIVEEHRGCIEVESRLGEGTTFAVWLPT